jgi:uncharacterized protein YxeA
LKKILIVSILLNVGLGLFIWKGYSEINGQAKSYVKDQVKLLNDEKDKERNSHYLAQHMWSLAFKFKESGLPLKDVHFRMQRYLKENKIEPDFNLNLDPSLRTLKLSSRAVAITFIGDASGKLLDISVMDLEPR